MTRRRLWVIEARYACDGGRTEWRPTYAHGVFHSRSYARTVAAGWRRHARDQARLVSKSRPPFALYRVKEYTRRRESR